MSEGFELPRKGTLENPVRVAVMISGGGSGLAALLRYQATARTHQTVLVLSDKTDTSGLHHGIDAGVQSLGIPLPEVVDAKAVSYTHLTLPTICSV